MLPLRSGLPEPSNVAGQYRLHADRIANSETEMPAHAVLVEISTAGALSVTALGPPIDGRSIKAALLAAADLSPTAPTELVPP